MALKKTVHSNAKKETLNIVFYIKIQKSQFNHANKTATSVTTHDKEHNLKIV